MMDPNKNLFMKSFNKIIWKYKLKEETQCQ